jgi:type I restriction enzyme M protein
MNGSPLFTGDAGGGESEIRRWILESDWLEAIVQLPEQLFYNTGITTYVWLLTNRKEERRRGKVQLIDASSLWVPMRRSLGDKRREISPEHIAEITRIHEAFEESDRSKIFATTDFGYRKITVERPLRLAFQASAERIGRLDGERAFGRLPEAEQEAIRAMLRTFPDTRFADRPAFERVVDSAAKTCGVKLAAPIRKAVLAALAERDETADVCRDAKGNPEPDSELRDTENVPLSESVEAFFEREVLPHVPDAWINTTVRDHKDGEVGKVGYEINFNRYFYTYVPPRPLEEIEADIRALESEILELLRGVAS